MELDTRDVDIETGFEAKLSTNKNQESLGNEIPLLEEDDAPEEDNFLHRIVTDGEGNLCQSNQVEDYLHRDDTLSWINWYDFCRCYQKVKRSTQNNNAKLPRFRLLAPHPDCNSHELVQRSDPRLG